MMSEKIHLPDRPLTPEDRRRGEFSPGAEVVLAGGAIWALPGAIQAHFFDEVRDRLFDEQTLTRKVAMADIFEAAYLLLEIAYDLDSEEIVSLLGEADHGALAEAVMAVLFGAVNNHRTYGDWVRSALLANGLIPDSIPARDLPHVLRHLVRTGRAETSESFISSMEAAGRRHKLLQMLGQPRAGAGTNRDGKQQ